MDRQLIPPDWSECNEAINSDFTNTGMFWFPNDSMLSDVPVYYIWIIRNVWHQNIFDFSYFEQSDNFENYEKISELDAINTSEFRDYMVDCGLDCNPEDSKGKTLANTGRFQVQDECPLNERKDFHSSNNIGKHSSSQDPPEINSNAHTSIYNSNGSSNLPKAPVKKKSIPASNLQGKSIAVKHKVAQKVPVTSKSKAQDIALEEDSDDDNSFFNSDDGKEDAQNSKSRSSSIDEDRTSDNDLAKRKLTKKTDIMNAREKNREHAKNTRMRKKNYIESLKENIKHLSDEREKSDQERKMNLSKLADQVSLPSIELPCLFRHPIPRSFLDHAEEKSSSNSILLPIHW